MSFPSLNAQTVAQALAEAKVVVKFTAPWCAPCRSFQPVLEKVAQAHGDVRFYEVNIDENPEIARQYHVRSIPTTMGFRQGQLQWQLQGAVPTSQIEKALGQL
jgi:thioredoxin